MTINRVLLDAKIKMNLTTILFLLINIFHLIFASTSSIKPKNDGLMRFEIFWMNSFKWQNFVIALILLVIQFIISYIVLWLKFRQSNLVEVNDLGLLGKNHEKIKKNLRMNPKKIYDYVMEQAEENKIKSIKRIYLTDTSIPNALTIDLVPLPFLRRSWIVLDANIIEILDDREIKAIIAHELGHVKRFDSIVNILRFGINFLVFIAYSLRLLEIMDYIIIERPPNTWNILSRLVFLLLFIMILWGFTIINRILMNFSRRQAELLADYFAGKNIGRNHIINALVLLGQRLDVVTAFGLEFKWLGNREGKSDVTREFLQGIKDLPAEELSKEISRKEALYIYVSQRLKNLKEDLLVPFAPEEIKQLAEEACQKLLAIRESELTKEMIKERTFRENLGKLTIDWLLVDKDNDLYLNDEEIEELMAIIKENPGKELFETDLYNRKLVQALGHPSIRSRILFLYQSLDK